MPFLKTPQKQERRITPKKTPEKRDEEDEYAGSTDVDEPSKRLMILIKSYGEEFLNWTICTWYLS